ncbi:hypothetical protein K458DRAFT_397905 [Lentithecium fluviatile CBS 122367]|uniref:Phosphodiester glycosidase domain-containing protein n=1 Tax=Lentithecium fluviatile CBS 122367 TaxID=1168545 RepID=A0A6G1JMF2_9PLEO|nr:hypothetical protein K458DRAFT_397905 [Lentithecium fluviatile CBS 122367]
MTTTKKMRIQLSRHDVGDAAGKDQDWKDPGEAQAEDHAKDQAEDYSKNQTEDYAKDQTENPAKEVSTPGRQEREKCKGQENHPRCHRRLYSASTAQGTTPRRNSLNYMTAEPDVTRWYRNTDFQPNRVTWWSFNSRNSLRRALGNQSRARPFLTAMRMNGKLDVISVTNVDLSVVGILTGGTSPHQFAGRTGSYLLSNSGFFVMGGQNAYSSVERTSSTPNSVNIPTDYNRHYEELKGRDDTFLWSGPSLKMPLKLKDPEFWYRDAQGQQTATSRVPGSLAHANQPNERLVIVTLPNGNKYLFVYTTTRTGDGVNVNQMRAVIETFLREFFRTTLAQTSQALNLDGGGSLYVSWNQGGREQVIATGSNRDGTPNQVANPRRATNLLKISTQKDQSLGI